MKRPSTLRGGLLVTALCLSSLMLFATVCRSQSIQCVTVYERNILTGMVTGNPCGKDSVMIYYLNDMVCYKLPYQYSSTEEVTSQATGITTRKRFSETRYQYFVMQKDETSGYLFDFSAPQFEKWESADSVIELRSILSNANANDLYEMLNQCMITSTQTINLPGNGLLKKYGAYSLSDSTTKLSFSMEFSDLIGNEYFSLSPQLDSIAGSKLIKSRVTVKSECLKECGLTGCDLSLGEIELLNKEITLAYPKGTEIISELFRRFEFVRLMKPDEEPRR